MRTSACPPCTRARARAGGSCPGPRLRPVARGCAAADPSRSCSQPARGPGPGTQARSLSPAYAGRERDHSRPARTIEVVIDEAEVRGMSLNERRQLARLLAELDGPPHDERPGPPNPSPDPGVLANPYLT